MRRRRRVSDAPGEKPPFGHQKSAERDFERKLNKVAGEIRKILENAKSEADLRVAQNRLREYAKLLGKWADIQAEQMVNRVFEANEKRWGGFVKEFGYDLKEKKGKEAAEKSDIAKAVIKMRTEAAKYIKDLPEGTAERVGHLAHEAMLHGMRPEAIQERIQNECEVSASRARLIARTEVARSNSVLVQARAESLGSEAYIWQTAEDGRVRESHREMNGKVCYWKDPPVLS
ncbi:MAG: phage head morphogenesis protein, partial [Synergistaceae bacterium]|nr:phage head morphogenesis protein [Synergistaceae bacterium]